MSESELIARLTKRLRNASPGDRQYERPMSWADAEAILDELSTLRARVAEVERERDSLAERLTDTWAENAESSDALVGVMAVATGNLAAMRERAEKAEREALSQAERIRVLEAALEPFATMDKVMRRYEGSGYPKIDDARPYQGGAAWADKDGNIRFVTNGDFARARAAMEPRNG